MDIDRLQAGSRPYLAIEFPPPPPGRPYVVINMVGSVDGKAVIEDTEQGLGSKEDKERMQELRALSDAVMNGAGTLRKSGASSRVRSEELLAFRRARGKPGQPLGVLVTTSGEFELAGPYFDGSGLECVVLASDISPARAAEIEARGPSVVPIPGGLPEGLRYLRGERGIEVLLCEGGPTLNAALLEVDAIDEWFITLSPALVGGRERLTVLEGSRTAGSTPLTLLSALANEHTGELYLRYRVRRSS